MRPPLKAVLFDLDGTLFDSIALLLACMRYAFEGFEGPHPTTEDWIAGIGTPLITQAFPDGDAEYLQAVVDAVKSRFKGVIVVGGMLHMQENANGPALILALLAVLLLMLWSAHKPAMANQPVWSRATTLVPTAAPVMEGDFFSLLSGKPRPA